MANSRMKKVIRWFLVLLVLAGGGSWASQKYSDKIAFWKSGAAPAARKSSAPTTAIVATRDIHFAITAAGEIGPLDAVSVRPEVGGIISQLSLDLGDKVKKGEVLFALNDYDLQTEKTSRKIEIAGAKLAVETQKIQVEKAKLSFDRTQELFKDKLVSQEIFDNARIDYALTRNSLDLAVPVIPRSLL